VKNLPYILKSFQKLKKKERQSWEQPEMKETLQTEEQT